MAWLRVVDGELLEEISQPAIEDARGLALLPDGTVAVTRWRSPDGVGRVARVDRDGPQPGWTLAYDQQLPSDTEIGGVPGYLDAILVAPTGREVALPSLQANVRHGPAFDGLEPTFDTVLRAVVSFVQLPENEEDFDARKQFDGRGFASAGVYSSHGDYLFLAMRGTQVIERLDRLTGSAAGTLVEAGYAVDGLALSADDRWLFADASLSREVRIWDVSDLRAVPRPAFRVPTVEAEPLAPEVLRGKQLFNDSADPRLSRDGYIACAHCHLEGDHDRLVWDFTARGEGLRNTISLLGRAGRAPIHWSGNFDEVQDFEHDIRGPFGGTGLLSDADFAAASTPLGPPKAGLSADLDALAAYVASLDTPRSSPFRLPDRRLSVAAQRGAALFDDLGCGVCHAGPDYTDSAFTAPGEPRLHDVGTLRPTSGQRLGGPLPGIDTPTLLGLFDSPPYLHDGSADRLEAVLRDRNAAGAHGPTADLDDAALADLVLFLLCLDGN
ncbi:MAG: cytochrome c peroxidase [bacterium]